jgi:hypothetical protein
MVLYGHRMEFRAAVAKVTDRIADAIDAGAVARSTIAHATDMSVHDLNERLAHREEFTGAELAMIGGVLRIHPADLIGAAA